MGPKVQYQFSISFAGNTAIPCILYGNRWADEPRFLSQEKAIDPYTMVTSTRKFFLPQEDYAVENVISNIGNNVGRFDELYLNPNISYRNIPLHQPERSRVCRSLPAGQAFEWCGCDRYECGDNVGFSDYYCYSCKSRYDYVKYYYHYR
jgi:hypothetical protein